MNNSHEVGISGISVVVPPYRVQLQDWCRWTGGSWDKTRAVIGNSFRMCGPQQSMYTMAAGAVLKLIDTYGIDPATVGYLALGTESSTDNAVGSVIVRGLVDKALIDSGRQPLARDCEVPEIKQACLAGIYGMKAALRYLAYDGVGRVAIVVAADIAEYERGSTGEPTQGAGAVALLLERSPKLLAFDLRAAGNASSYRITDFRKPFLRFCEQSAAGVRGRPRDYPVFNGKYSTVCYTDETLRALESLFAKRSDSRAHYLASLDAVFLHRPYHKMPVTAWAMGYLFALAADGGPGHDELGGYCQKAGVDLTALVAELQATADVAAGADQGTPIEDGFPLANQALKAFRDSPRYAEVVDGKMKLGSTAMMELGNLYSAAVLAWLAAGIEEAFIDNRSMVGKELLLMGYGSGDAAEAIPCRVMPEWRSVAGRIGLREACAVAVDLTQSQYAELHAGRDPEDLPKVAVEGFVVDRIGSDNRASFQDIGVEYYRYVSAGPADTEPATLDRLTRPGAAAL